MPLSLERKVVPCSVLGGPLESPRRYETDKPGGADEA